MILTLVWFGVNSDKNEWIINAFCDIDTRIIASFNCWPITPSGCGVSARASTRTGILDTIGARWKRVGPVWTLATKLTPVHEPSPNRKPRRWPITFWPIKRTSGIYIYVYIVVSKTWNSHLISGNEKSGMMDMKFFKGLSDVALLFANVARTVGIHVFETVRLFGIDERG